VIVFGSAIFSVGPGDNRNQPEKLLWNHQVPPIASSVLFTGTLGTEVCKQDHTPIRTE